MKNLMRYLKSLEIMFKNALVGMVSLYLRRRLSKTTKPDLNRPLKVLFIRPERIGDTLISFPVVDILKKKHANWEMSWIAAPRTIDFVADDPRFKYVFLYAKRLSKDLAMIRRARREKFDIAIDLINRDSASTLALTYLAAPKAYKISMGKCRHGQFYHIDLKHPFTYSSRHVLETTLGGIVALGLDPSEAKRFCPPHVTETKKAEVDGFLKGLPQPTKDRTLIGVNISSGETCRVWDIDNYRRTIAELMAKYRDLHFIIIATPDDFQIGQELADSFGDRVHIPPRAMHICSVAELISRLNLLITTDTSLLHIARSYRIPVVGLYRAHKINIWFPYAQLSGMVISDAEEHLFNITINQVVEKTIEIGGKFRIPGFAHV